MTPLGLARNSRNTLPYRTISSYYRHPVINSGHAANFHRFISQQYSLKHYGIDQNSSFIYEAITVTVWLQTVSVKCIAKLCNEH